MSSRREEHEDYLRRMISNSSSPRSPLNDTIERVHSNRTVETAHSNQTIESVHSNQTIEKIPKNSLNYYNDLKFGLILKEVKKLKISMVRH